MRGAGCVYAYPIADESARTSVNELTREQLHSMDLRGIPVCIHHNLDRHIGTITDQFTDARGGKHVVWDVDLDEDDIDVEILKQQQFKELSLTHDYETLLPRDVALTWEGGRPGCTIYSGDDPDVYRRDIMAEAAEETPMATETVEEVQDAPLSFKSTDEELEYMQSKLGKVADNTTRQELSRVLKYYRDNMIQSVEQASMHEAEKKKAYEKIADLEKQFKEARVITESVNKKLIEDWQNFMLKTTGKQISQPEKMHEALLEQPTLAANLKETMVACSSVLASREKRKAEEDVQRSYENEFYQSINRPVGKKSARVELTTPMQRYKTSSGRVLTSEEVSAYVPRSRMGISRPSNLCE